MTFDPTLMEDLSCYSMAVCLVHSDTEPIQDLIRHVPSSMLGTLPTLSTFHAHRTFSCWFALGIQCRQLIGPKPQKANIGPSRPKLRRSEESYPASLRIATAASWQWAQNSTLRCDRTGYLPAVGARSSFESLWPSWQEHYGPDDALSGSYSSREKRTT